MQLVQRRGSLPSSSGAKRRRTEISTLAAYGSEALKMFEGQNFVEEFRDSVVKDLESAAMEDLIIFSVKMYHQMQDKITEEIQHDVGRKEKGQIKMHGELVTKIQGVQHELLVF